MLNEHCSQVMDQGRRQCCHNKNKNFPYRPTRDVSLLSGHDSHIDSAVRLTTGPQYLLKHVLHIARASVSSFNLQYTAFSLRSSCSCLRLLSRLPFKFFLPSIFPSITCFRRQFLPNMWPIQLAFLFFIHSYNRLTASTAASTLRSKILCFLYFKYPVFSLRSSSSCLCLLPRLLFTSILPSIFPSMTCFRRQFLRKITVSSPVLKVIQ